MADASGGKKRATPQNLLGVLAFLRRYPGQVVFCIAVLLAHISIEMALPQVLGSAITQLRWHVEWGAQFSPSASVELFASLVLVRAGLGLLLGAARNRLIQTTLGDIRSAIYDALRLCKDL